MPGAWSTIRQPISGGPNMTGYCAKWELFKNIKEPLPHPRG